MTQPDKDTSLPPAYTESISSPSPHHSGTQSILTNLTQTRTTHIHTTITTHILPLIVENATHGISKTTIALLPSDIALPIIESQPKSEFSFDYNDNKNTSVLNGGVEVIGFSSDDEEEVKIVRLDGRMNRLEFWRVGSVVGELERVLRDWVNGGEVAGRGETRAVDTVGEDGDGSRQTRRRLLGRLVPSLGPEVRSASGNPEVGTKLVEKKGLMVVKARLEEICLRTVNDFGLYETMSKQCVIVKVDAG